MRVDYGLRNLLDLDDTVLVLNEMGYWVKFAVRQVLKTGERPHGIDYSLTLHGPDNERLVGFDNAHAVRRSRGPGGRAETPWDHRHRYSTIRKYADALSLIDDFWAAVDEVLEERQ